MDPILKNSSTDPIACPQIALGLGFVGMTFCPGKKGLSWNKQILWDRDLDVDLRALRATGAQHLVSLIEPHEFSMLDVALLPQKAQEHGFDWHFVPIKDGCAPDNRFGLIWPDLKRGLSEKMRKGEGVIVHCRGGLGRTGLVTALLVKHMHPEIPMDLIIAHVRSLRPGAIETQEQEDWLCAKENPEVREKAPNFSPLADRYIRLVFDYRQFVRRDGHITSADQNCVLDELEMLWSSLAPDQQKVVEQRLRLFSDPLSSS